MNQYQVQLTYKRIYKKEYLSIQILTNKMIKEQHSTQKIVLNSTVKNLLSLEYLITFPNQITSLSQIVHLAVKGLQTNILKLKYGLTSQTILKYHIQLQQQSQHHPFQPAQIQLINQIQHLSDTLINKKDYNTITNTLSTLNILLHGNCHHRSLRDEETQVISKIQNQPTPKLQMRAEGKLHQKEIQTYQNEQKANPFPTSKLMIHLTPTYRIFYYNFKYLNLKEAIIYQGLSRCQIWYTICRQRRKNTKGFFLDPLINTFDSIVKKIQLQNSPFHVSVLPRKNIKKLQQKKNIQKAKNALFEAVCNRNHKQVKQLILNGADIEAPALESARLTRQMRCAHKAAQNNDLQMCKILTSFGVNWESQDSEKMSPIYYAIQGRSLQVLKYLVEQVGADIEKKQIQNRTPFYWACTEGELQFIKYLYQKGANINHKSKLGRCPLSKACFLGRRDIVEFLLGCKQIDMYSQDQKGRTALHNATFGAKGGRQGQKFGTNASDSPQCAQLLLEKGFQVDFLDFQNNTSLHIAMSSEALDSIKLLVAFGASLEKVNDYGQTPIMTGAKFGHLQSVRLLHQHYHASLKVKDIFDKNLLLLVTKFRQFKQKYDKNAISMFNGDLQKRKDIREKYTEINPVFNYILDDFIKEHYHKYLTQDKFIKNQLNEEFKAGQIELHYTFKEMLYNAVHEEFMIYTKKLIEYKVPFPQLTLKDVKFLLSMEQLLHSQQDKQIVVKLLHSKNDEGYHVFQLEKQGIVEFVTWLVQKNNLKLLQFASDNEILMFYHFSKQKGEQQDYFCDIPMDIIVCSLPVLKQKVLSYCLLNLTFNWLDYVDPETGENILHKLVRHRKVGTIIQLTKYLGGKKMDFVRNKYLISLTKEQKRIQAELKQNYDFICSPLHKTLLKLLMHKNYENITPFQMAHIMKETSTIKILGQRINQNSLSIGDKFKALENYEVKEFTIEKQEQDQQQIKLFDMGYQIEKQSEQLAKQISNCDSFEQLENLIPILRKDPNKICQLVNIDGDGKYQWQHFKERPLYYIKTLQDIHLLTKLLESSVVGIDVEYDFADGNQTIICILQLSSLSEDYIVDMMSCTSEKGENKYIEFIKKIKETFFKPFAYNPKIVKLMHGSDHDLYILKSCFNISFLNFLDSSRIDVDLRKNNAIRGLATITKEYLKIQMSKQHQISEWKIRPIPQTMLQYARKDALIMPFLIRKMLLHFKTLEELKDTILNGFRHAKKNKRPNQPLIKKLLPIT